MMPQGLSQGQDPATRVLQDRVRQLLKILPAALASDEEGIHDMRVTTRRLGVLLPLIAAKPEGKRLRRAIRSMRKLRRTAGTSRDRDVSLGLFRENIRGAEWEAPGIDALRQRLRAARGRAQRRMEYAIKDLALPHLRRDLERIAQRGTIDSFAVHANLKKREKEVGAAVLDTIEKLGDRYDPDALHQLRSRIRRLRYLAELRAGLSPRTAEAPKRLRALQDLLGHLHDAHVLSTWLVKQERRSHRRGQKQLADQALRLRHFFLQMAQDHHHKFLATDPSASVREAIRIMDVRESVA